MKRPAPIGKKFNRLTIIREVDRENDNHQRFVECRCDCGNLTVVNLAGVKIGRPKSCGCLHRETAAKVAKVLGDKIKHGMTNHQLYAVWSDMRSRCNNPKHQAYKNYGGRGISVCKEWTDSFEAFYAWAKPRWKPGLTLDRKENNGNYEPGNCRFTTYKKQNNNSRNNHRYEYYGEHLTIPEIAAKYGVSDTLVRNRLQKGWSIDDAVMTIKRSWERRQ